MAEKRKLDADEKFIDPVISLQDIIEEDVELETTANAVLGGSNDQECTYADGYVQRQALYACATCKTTSDAGICLACSLECHDGHELFELYTKRSFRCDCGNSKFPNLNCTYFPDKVPTNDKNSYNHNFKGTYCTCKRPYPDPEDDVDDEMVQCVACEDWFHSRHLHGNGLPEGSNFAEMICHLCMKGGGQFLWFYNWEYTPYETSVLDVDGASCSTGVQSAISAKNSTDENSVSESSEHKNEVTPTYSQCEKNSGFASASQDKTSLKQKTVRVDSDSRPTESDSVSKSAAQDETSMKQESANMQSVMEHTVTEQKTVKAESVMKQIENDSVSESVSPIHSETKKTENSVLDLPSQDENSPEHETVKVESVMKQIENSVSGSAPVHLQCGKTENSGLGSTSPGENSSPKQKTVKIESDLTPTESESSCKLAHLKKVYESCKFPDSAAFWPDGWREKLCTCAECKSKMSELCFLYSGEDTVGEYEKLGAGRYPDSSMNSGMKALGEMNRIQQIEVIQGYNDMKTKLSEYLRTFAQQGKVVTEKDIKLFFQRMSESKRVKVDIPHSCK